MGISNSVIGMFLEGKKLVGVQITGWADPTGTVARTTFDQSTVTLPELGKRVAALILDLKTHGLIAT